MDDMPTFADSLISHMQARKKHNYIKIASALCLFVLDFIFVAFLLTPLVVVWDPLFDAEIGYVGISERMDIVSDNVIVNTTDAVQNTSIDDGQLAQYDITSYVYLLILAPFLTAAYLLYLGISGAMFYRSWNKRYQEFLQRRKSLHDEFDDLIQ